MGRKRKQIDPEGKSKAILPPCHVCEAPGAGFHYGANTCEACKGFFHRSMKISNQYKCEDGSHCAIEHGRNKLCQYCRYQKCLSVGMAKEAIKTGRYTSVKRTSDILEIKRLQEKKYKPLNKHEDGTHQTLLNQTTGCMGSGGENSLDSDSQTGQYSVLYGNTVQQISSGCLTQIKSEESDCLIQTGPSGFVSAANQRPCDRMCGQLSSGGLAKIKLELTDSLIGKRSSGLTSVVNQRQCVSMCGQIFSKSDNQNTRTCTTIYNMVKAEGSPDISTVQEVESLFTESPDNQSCQPAHQSFTLSSTTSPSSVTSPYSAPSEDSLTKPSPSMLTDVASSLLSLSSAAVHSSGPPSSSSAYTAYITPTSLHSPSSSAFVNSPATSLLSPTTSLLSPSSVTSPASSITNGAASSLSSSSSSSFSNLEMQMYMSDSPNSAYDTVGDPTDKTVSEMYQDKDAVIRILQDADESFVVPLIGRMTEEEIKKEQQEHFEACKLQREMFGQLRRLPDHEYDYIFATTGLDTDDRQKRLHIMGAGLEKVIRAMVKFCKIIPGFSKLDISDKVKLIKYSRQEFCLFTIYKFINAERKIMRGLDNQWKCENEMSRLSSDSDSVFIENLDLHFRFCHSLQNLKLSDDELVVIRALVIMAPDRNPHTDSPIAREIHWKLNECLIHVLSQRYPNPLYVFAKIVGKLTEARSQTENMIRFFKRLKIDKYSNVKNNPLLREMCSGIFFDDKDDDGTNANS